MFSIARCLLRTKYQFQQKGDYNRKLFLNFKYNGLCSRALFFVESISDLNRRVCTMGRCLIVLCLFTKFFRVRAKIYKSRSSISSFFQIILNISSRNLSNRYNYTLTVSEISSAYDMIYCRSEESDSVYF